MSDKQIIEEMARTLGGCHSMPNCKVCCAYIGSTYCFDKTRAERLYNAGYRKESDTAREILDMIDGVPTNEVNELNHLRLLKNAIVKRYGVDLTEDKE